MKCPICNSDKNTKIFTASNVHGRHQINSQKIAILKCDECSCIFPKIKTDKNFYKKYYPKNYQTPTKNKFLIKIYQNFNYHYQNKLIPQNSILLDVGCGQGDFIKQLPKGINAYGIDINPLINKNIIKDDFLKHRFSKKFNIITFWHSLEHFKNPKKALDKAINLLKPNGKILISIPNTNSFAFNLGQRNWFHLDPPRHLFLPNSQNIKKLFPKNSKINLYFHSFEFPLDLFWSLKKHPYLRIIYPILKIFDHETMMVVYQKN